MRPVRRIPIAPFHKRKSTASSRPSARGVKWCRRALSPIYQWSWMMLAHPGSCENRPHSFLAPRMMPSQYPCRTCGRAPSGNKKKG
ncbi:hypothetical protein HII31_05259 [Pseudocercospora fuligena]|uniref:Uncharacterized protein n=1 Tax=Pseudocercospora fuligena TaxID=685502 RepID=A0A8H6RLT4_9PEZI|nr:hypothetical protein HII31_05259 [Pseudocercospora fuligena]